jgi:hypothetical protein
VQHVLDRARLLGDLREERAERGDELVALAVLGFDPRDE